MAFRSADGWLVRILTLSLMMTAVVQAVRPMASYKVLNLGGSVADVGIVAAAFGLLSLFFAVPIGRWVDRAGEWRFLIVGAAMMAASAAGAAMSTGIAMLALSLAILGLGHVALAVGLQTMIANRGSQADRDSRFGAFSVTQSLGQLIGPAAAGLLAADQSGSPAVDVVFVVSAVIALVSAPLALSLRPKRPETPPKVAIDPLPTERMGPAVRRVLAVPSMRQALLGGITVVVGANVLIAYLPVYGEASGISVEVIGLLLALRAAASMASRLSLGWIRRRVNRRTLLVACLIGPALALFTVAVLSETAVLFLTMLVVGFGLGLGQPLTLSWIAGQSPPELRGTAVSLRMAGNRVGQFAIPATLGVIGGLVGVSGIFWSLGFLLLLSAALVRTGPFVEEPQPG